MMKKNFEYIEIEEGKSQYEEYDLTETKQWMLFMYEQN